VLEQTGDQLGLGRHYFEQGLIPEALAALDPISEADPQYRLSISLRGEIHLSKNEMEKAKECFEKALVMAQKLNNADIDTIYNLAVVSEKTETYSNALEILERNLTRNLIEPDYVEKATSVRRILVERFSGRTSQPNPNFSSTQAPQSQKDTTRVTAPTSRRYAKIKEIGRGGMGVVYTARDKVLDRIVALKVLPSSFKSNQQAVQTFLREAKAAAALNHPNIVIVHDSGMQDDDYYIAMEFIEGNTIKEILRIKKKFNLASVAEVMKQLLSALAYAHSKSVVHRDLTTNTVMWTKHKNIKIMDFGLAKIIKDLMSEQSIDGFT